MAAATSDWNVSDDLWTQAAKRATSPALTAPSFDTGWIDSSADPLAPGPAAATTSAPASAPAAPVAPAAPASSSTASPATSSPYASLVSGVANAPDPTSQINAQDTLGRTLYSDLQAAGHDVEWDSSGNLIVDGKPYSVAGSTTTVPTASTLDVAVPRNPTTPAPTTTTPPATTTPATGAPVQTGTDPTTGAPIFGTPQPSASPSPSATTAPSTSAPPGSVSTVGLPFPPGGIDGVTQAGFGNPSSDLQVLSGLLLQHPDSPQAAIDQFNAQRPGSSLAPAWESGSQTIGLGNGTYLVQPGTGGNSGANWQVVQRGNESGGSSTNAGIDFTQLFQQLEAGGLVQTPTYTPTPIDASKIPWLQNPETFSPQLISELESKNSESQMAAAQLADEDAARFGAANDLGSSPWLASQRTANLQTARQGIISGTENIDVQAQTQNAQDRLTAAGMIVDIDKFNETIKQQATSLGISAETLKANVMSTLLNLYEEQQQFGGNLQLSYDELQRLLNNDAWNRATQNTGAA